jgi:Do/DeqQ family serine protease
MTPFHRFATCLALVLLALVPPAWSQPAAQRAVPQARAEMQLSFAPLVKQVAPAVVNVFTKRVERAQRPAIFDEPFFRRFFGDEQQFGVPRERVAQSLGSGVIVDPKGLVVTNNHVIEGATEITVALADRREFAATLVAADKRTDLAILRIDAGREPLPHLEFADSDRVEVGDLVLAIGNPFGVGQTVTSGIVSALGRTDVGALDTQSFIQTDAAINPGNSGGPLIGIDGRIIGINTVIFSRSGGSIGIGFAIPSNLVAATLAGAAAGRGIVRPWLGAGAQPVTAEIAQGLGLPRPAGVLITNVYRGGPADRAGLRSGDLVLKVDGRDVFDPQTLKFRIASRPIGETTQFDLQRQGRPLTLRLPLEAAPETPPRSITELRGEHPLAGATVANLSPAFNDEIGFDQNLTGVVVTGLVPGSPAAFARVRPGDIVLNVNGSDVVDVARLQTLLRRTGAWQIQLRRGTQLLNLVTRG